MDWELLGYVLVLITGLSGAVRALWKRSQVQQTTSWPVAQATIESGKFQKFAQDDGPTIRLSVFTFSYEIAGKSYSGKFSLCPYITDPGESICTRMIGRKLEVRYDPDHPETWYIVEKLIEGCKVKQKMDPHFLNVVPAD